MTGYCLRFCYYIRPLKSCICYSRRTNDHTISINAKRNAYRKERDFRLHATKTHKQKQVQSHSFFISELDERPVEQEVRCRTPESVRTFWRREKSVAPPGNRAPDRPARSIVTILIELSRLTNAKLSRKYLKLESFRLTEPLFLPTYRSFIRSRDYTFRFVQWTIFKALQELFSLYYTLKCVLSLRPEYYGHVWPCTIQLEQVTKAQKGGRGVALLFF